MFIQHITKDGERWDLLAHYYYGDVGQIPLLVDANPHIPITETLTGGQVLFVPVIEATVPNPEEDLPPWKR